MTDFADFFPDSRKDPIRFEDSHPSIFHAKGPIRTSEFPASKANRKINKHQESVKHNNTCRCKQYEYNNDIVMYEHIEQYPQFSCYCKLCLEMVMGFMSNGRDEFNEMMKSKLLTLLEFQGIKLPDKPKVKEFDAMVNIGLLTGDQTACKIADVMDSYNMKPNEDDSGIETLNIEARNVLPFGEGYNNNWKSLSWKCRNCDNAVYSENNPSWNGGEKGTWPWCGCDKMDTYFDKEGTIRGIKSRKEFGTDFLDRGVWN